MLFGKSKRRRIITGLDIGTTKVCAIIGQADPDGTLTILGVGSCPSKGLQSGEVIEIQPTVEAIMQACDRAVEVAGVPISEVYVGIAGEHIVSQNTRAMVEIRHPMRGIDEKDINRVVQKAMEISVPDKQMIIHSVVQEFQVNGHRTKRPITLSASNMEVGMHVVLSDVDVLSNVVKCVRKVGLRNPTIVLQSLASSMSVVTAKERNLGVLLVDIGGGTTDLAIFKDDAIRATGEVAMAGDRITRDVAEVLGCAPSDAENVKKRYGSARPELVERGRTFEVPMAGDVTRMATHEEYHLAEIIEARLEEIFQFVKRDLVEASYDSIQLRAGAVLTGGTALIPGITEVAERILEMPCRLGVPRNMKGFATVVSSPIYSTGVGLVRYGMDDGQPIVQRRGRVRRALDSMAAVFGI
jgi:cell division protein FtsA